MGRWFEKHLIALVFGFIGAIFSLVGAGFLWGGFHTQQAMKLADQVPLYTAAQLANLPAGSPVAVEGQISERNSGQVEGMVAYTEYQYQGIRCDDDDCEEEWDQTEKMTPALWLDLPDGRVRIGNTDYSLLNPPVLLQTRPDLVEGVTLEYQGYRMGNPVYAMGQVNRNDGLTLTVEFLSGGTREDYLLSQAEGATIFFWMGGIFAGFGFIFLTVAVVTALLDQ